MTGEIARRTLVAGVAGAALVPTAADAATRTGLDSALRARLGSRVGSVGVTVFDARTGARFALNGATTNDTASIVKVLILATLLRRRRRQGTWLDVTEQGLAGRMIRYSDNDAAYALWLRAGGADGVQAMAADLGLGSTTTGPCRAVPGTVTWGRTLTTSDDQVRLLRAIAWGTPQLLTADRAYVLRLMGQVAPDQRFGVGSVGAGLDIRLKNGWAPRPTHGWRHNSIGLVSGAGRHYALAVLTKDNASDAAGRSLVTDLARIVHAQLSTPLR